MVLDRELILKAEHFIYIGTPLYNYEDQVLTFSFFFSPRWRRKPILVSHFTEDRFFTICNLVIVYRIPNWEAPSRILLHKLFSSESCGQQKAEQSLRQGITPIFILDVPLIPNISGGGGHSGSPRVRWKHQGYVCLEDHHGCSIPYHQSWWKQHLRVGAQSWI